MNLVRWPTIPEAAQIMGVDRSTAWRHFTELQRQHPDREVLRGGRGPGKRTGKLRVCPQALVEVVHPDREDRLGVVECDIKSLETGVGSLVTTIELIKMRLRRVERAQKPVGKAIPR